MDLKTLIIQPKEYFKNFKEDEYENKEPLRLIYLFVALVVISLLCGAVEHRILESGLTTEGMNGAQSIGSIGNSGDSSDKPIFMVFTYLGDVIVPLIWAWICVNILCLVNEMSMGVVEKNEIKDKKYFKSLLYFRFIVFSIVTSILSTISMIILRDMKLFEIASFINSIFIKLWAAYFLYGILKYYLQTEKLHKILPIIIYILTLIYPLLTIAKAMFSNIV
ncbi:hypothetical protein GCM10008904_24860 [Paraclostridium ghonii]|uniref:Yip1 domain-containing protein n=1 Tax=Paraclostridium ghonii TaxID=29358 RepID=A0ABU0MZX2_9FIRM|nr:YIP1 family protein [Paeniclostridium ghonii]MDQ0556163.1 hypothetical protein [Paeniclostridium ghonii]